MRVAVVTNLPRPYRHALFNEVARQSGAGASLAVIYCSEQSMHPRRRQVEARCEAAHYARIDAHPSHLLTRGDKVHSIALGLPGLLRKLQPDVAVVAGFGPDAVDAHVTCRGRGIPVVVWSGAWVGGELPISRYQRRVRRWLVAGSAAWIGYGQQASEYLVSLGADPKRVAVAVNTVDLDRFSALAEEGRAAPDLAAKYGLSPRNLLYVGTLEQRKGVRELVEAYAQMNTGGSDCALHLVGSGPLAAALQDRAALLPPGKGVRLHGFLQEEEVARLAGHCDLFVCPSLRELWGLVINEAMACGLPVVASKHAGATRDLITDGREGLVVDPGQPRDLAEKMGLLVRDPELARGMGRQAAITVRERASLESSARGFIRGVEIALDPRRGATRSAC
jgi:glycosyltransferase involved in cell wall biosynthesis